jgi:hypothetical protein
MRVQAPRAVPGCRRDRNALGMNQQHQPGETTMTTTNPPETITIDGVIYTRAVDATPTEWRIVIAQRGWVFVGRWNQDGEQVTLTDAKTIRVWGTTAGLGQLAINGPTTKTICDPAGTVRMHILGVVATLDTQVTAW